MSYRADIDGLRAFAVVPVIFFHAGFEVFSGGFVGVDVFFVISGYLITGIICRELETGSFSIVKFYERRARRILPALLLVMTACVPVAWVVLVPRDFQDFAQSLVAVATFSSNILFWTESGYFETAAELKPLLHTWSLSVEEQYYIVFPLLMMALASRSERLVFFVVSSLSLLSFAVCTFFLRHDASASFFLFPMRAWEIGIGALCALLSSKPWAARTGGPVRGVLSMAGLLMIVTAIFSLDGRTPFPGFYALLPTLGTALVLTTTSRGSLTATILGNPLCVGIGLVSYSAYLWHQPIFAFLRYSRDTPPGATQMLALALAVFPLAYLSWLYVERPFRSGSEITRKAIFLLSGAGLAGFVALGLVGHLQKGFDGRLVRSAQIDRGAVGHDAFFEHMETHNAPCTPAALFDGALKWGATTRCFQSRLGGTRDIALIGDSHAEHLFTGLQESMPGRMIVYYIRYGMPIEGNDSYDDIFSIVAEDRALTTVVLTFHYLARVGQLVSPSELAAMLTEKVRFLRDNGKRVVLAGDVPLFWFDPVRCAFATQADRRGRCEMDESVVIGMEAAYTPILETLAQQDGVEFIPLRDVICQDGVCHMAMGDTLLYRDPNHLNVEGSRRVGAALADRSRLLHWSETGITLPKGD